MPTLGFFTVEEKGPAGDVFDVSMADVHLGLVLMADEDQAPQPGLSAHRDSWQVGPVTASPYVASPQDGPGWRPMCMRCYIPFDDDDERFPCDMCGKPWLCTGALRSEVYRHGH